MKRVNRLLLLSLPIALTATFLLGMHPANRQWANADEVPAEIWQNIEKSLYVKNVTSDLTINIQRDADRSQPSLVCKTGIIRGEKLSVILFDEVKEVRITRKEVMPLYTLLPSNVLFPDSNLDKPYYGEDGNRKLYKSILDGEMTVQDVIGIGPLNIILHMDNGDFAIMKSHHYDAKTSTLSGTIDLRYHIGVFDESVSPNNIFYDKDVQKGLFESELDLSKTKAAYFEHRYLLYDGENEYFIFMSDRIITTMDRTEYSDSYRTEHTHRINAKQLYPASEVCGWIYYVLEPSENAPVDHPQSIQAAINALPEYKRRTEEYYSTIGTLPD